MKAFIAICLMFLLAALSPVSEARDHGGGARDKRAWHATHRDEHRGAHRHKRHHRAHHKHYYERHHSRPRHRGYHFRYKHSVPRHYRGYYHRHWKHRYRHGRHYRHDRYYPAVTGSALLGAAIVYRLFHTHHGRVCYDAHATGYDYGGTAHGGRRYEVVGCHRIERLPDGRERRVEVPLSECD